MEDFPILAFGFEPPMESMTSVDPEQIRPDADTVKHHPELRKEKPKKKKMEEKKWFNITYNKEYNLDYRFVSYVLLVFMVLIIILFILQSVIKEHDIYSRETGFPSLVILFIGTLISFIILAYVSYKLTLLNNRNRYFIFWIVVLFLLFYTFWIFNIGFRAEQFDRGRDHDGNGLFYIASCTLLLFLLFFIIYKSDNECSTFYLILLLIPIFWTIFLNYQWVTK